VRPETIAVTRGWLAVATCVALGCGGAERPPERQRSPARPAHAHGAGHGHGHGKGPLVHRFDDPERWAREFDDPARDAWQRPEEVVRVMEIAPGATVADLGAGTGYFEKHLSKAVGPTGRVLALDIEETMVRYMRDRAAREGLTNVEARAVAVDDPGLAPGTVDRILIVDTWHHIPDRPTYGRKLAAALRQGGAVFVVDFPVDGARGPPPHARIAPAEVVRELEAAGMQAEVLTESLPDQYVVRARAR